MRRDESEKMIPTRKKVGGAERGGKQSESNRMREMLKRKKNRREKRTKTKMDADMEGNEEGERKKK